MGIYLKYVGAKQGAFTGGATEAGHVGSIVIHSLDFGLGHHIDPTTHLSTGKQVLRPVVITKEIDKASPLLIQSCYQNEAGRTCVFTYTKTNTNGQTQTYLTIELQNSTISDFNHSAVTTGLGTERVTLIYTKLDFTWSEGGIMTSIDMMAPA